MFMLWRFRIIAFYTIISFISLLFFIGICIPLRFIKTSYSFRYKICYVYSHIFIYLLWGVVGIKYGVHGLEKLPAKGPYLVLSNHQSFWENFFMQVIIPEHSWVIKRELFNIPVFGWGLNIVEPIAVDRSDTSSVVQILNEGQKKLNQGLPIIIFPESTRIKVDKTVGFKPSAAKLALAAKVPVVLIAHNAGTLWPKGVWFKEPGLITVKVLEVIPPEEILQHDARSLTNYIQDRINTEKNLLVGKARTDAELHSKATVN